MQRTTASILAISIAFAAASAVAGEPVGPPIGSNRYTASVRRVCSEADADDYAQALAKGERLSVSVAAAKDSALLPRIVLVAPDGAEVTPAGLSVKKRGRAVSLKGWTVPATGRWGVRVHGADDTEGAYTIAFSVAPPPALRAKKLAFTSDTMIVPFDAVEGAAMDVALSWSPPSAVVTLERVEDPSLREVPGVAAKTRGASISVKGLTLHTGDGAYGLRLRRVSGVPLVDVKLSVRPAGRPSGKKAVALGDDEPWLEDVAEPIRGIPGNRVRFLGGNFTPGAAPAVLFGRDPAIVSVVSPDALDVYPPECAGGATVDVTVLDASGQSCTKDAYFHYAASPHVTDLVDANYAQLRTGAAAGGNTGYVRGTGLALGQTVRFGTAEATVVALSGSIQAEVVIPPGKGAVSVAVVDAWGRASTSSFQYRYKSPPELASNPYTPSFGAVAGGTTVTVTGTGFEPTDRLTFDGEELPVTYLGPNGIRFVTPGRDPGTYAIAIFDHYAGRTDGPAFVVKTPPSVASAVAIGGPRVDASRIAAGGGTIVEVAGEFLSPSDTVTLGGAPGAVTSCSGDTLVFTTGAAPLGFADLVVTDAAGQSATLEDALELVGYGDATASRSPGASDADDLSATRGALADFDGDRLADDVVLVTPDSPGTRSERTRLLLSEFGSFTDSTAWGLPSDAAPARSIAVGDLDGNGATDFVVGGSPVPGGGGDFEVRGFLNDGTGSFWSDADAPLVRTDPWTCIDQAWGGTYSLFVPDAPQGEVTGISIGDLDGDGDEDMAIGTDRFRSGYLTISFNYVSFYGDQAYAWYAGWYYWWPGQHMDSPALRIFENRRDQGEGYVDRTFTRMPRAQSYGGWEPAFHSRDLKSADVDGDGDLDLVLAWDDPTTVTPAGILSPGSLGPSVATRVLVNDGAGAFTDATSSWMPSPAGDEYWQAHRMLLEDLDGDGDPDLVLAHRSSIDAFRGATTYAARALRVLRNDGDGTGFVDVTSSALPSVPLAGTSDDNLRGSALALLDFDGDGALDLLVGTRETLYDSSGAAVRSTRLLQGNGSLGFADASGYLVAPDVDSGEADDLLVGDLDGAGELSILLLTETTPSASENGERFRIFDW